MVDAQGSGKMTVHIGIRMNTGEYPHLVIQYFLPLPLFWDFILSSWQILQGPIHSLQTT
jgi:hypothetical protein